MALLDKEGGLLHGQVSAIVEMVESELREVGGVHDWEAIVGDVVVDFWMCKEEGTEFGLRAVEVFEDLLSVGNCGDGVVIDFDEPSTSKVGTPMGQTGARYVWGHGSK